MNRTIFITGASTGLGLSLSKGFMEAGDTVIGITKTKRHWPKALKQVNSNSKFKLICADLTKEKAVAALVKKIQKAFPKIDILINNAGYIDHVSRVEKTSAREFKNNFEINLFSAFLMCKTVLPIFIKQKSGLIINISSMAGKRAVPRLAGYSASKFGVLALSQCIAKENIENNIKCFTICPGGMNTEMREKVFGKEDAQKQQAPDFVADVIMKTVSGEIPVDSGGDIVIRHGKITAINPVPEK
ncbi:MAG: hypothetical protein A3G33_03295 [Omnitrophica bacterium RIFCSPLOWO2_12_FULL_44_17]|uniref:3-oxoacyl-ACP reductase n=1 Tax=Candidatus Danuiimicrobium aquiferis TaxID=1801832 RepID=A0A1G1KTP9_9BACT|nr:MAG: hypothetical protein A3B72_06840 [Omnitrophica bacterium RIFCSPHIGHO2_02_FULL_45_28]OGW96344.1 MAG: hypothetical protein A3G33_03295 [Omnitrophica bacterium RIFCSPLOWO2_12_FULL_44_17]OGX04847.1 MAG: hypothetical protein A3J12_07835 [Omnitrophica bacterium RIFCSPLOWO2_02_FULL_44_11]